MPNYRITKSIKGLRRYINFQHETNINTTKFQSQVTLATCQLEGQWGN